MILTSRAQRWNRAYLADINFNQHGYDDHIAYAQSKATDVLLTIELDRHAKVNVVRAFAVHPRLMPGTGLGRFMTSHRWEQVLFALGLNELRLTEFLNWQHRWAGPAIWSKRV